MTLRLLLLAALAPLLISSCAPPAPAGCTLRPAVASVQSLEEPRGS